MQMVKHGNKERIPQHVIDDLIAQVDIVDTIGHHLKLKKQGKDFVALCPFHKESSPSFSVNPTNQFYYCFGCGAGGNAMKFLQDYSGRSFLSVLHDMAEDAHVDLSPFMMSARKDDLALKILPAVNEARKYFESSLRNAKGSQLARDYLDRRNIPIETTELFNIGFAGYGRDIVDALSEHQVPLIEAGLLDKSESGDLFSLFRDRIIMPIRDTRGKAIGLSGRALTEDVKPKYRNTKETAHFSKNNVLYGLYESLQTFAAQKLKKILVVEGQFDVMACVIAGYAACAAMGSSVSAQQLRLLLRHAEDVTFVFDGDAAGTKVMVQVCKLLLDNLTDLDVAFNVVVMPSGEDPHSMLNANPQQFRDLVDSPWAWMDALLTFIPEAGDLQSDRGRSQYAVAAVELAHGTRDPLLRYQLMEKAAAIAKMPVEALNERLISFPVTRSAKLKQPVSLLSEHGIRLARILWDRPEWVHFIDYPDLWSEEGDPLVEALGVWAMQVRSGEFDTPLSKADMKIIERDSIWEEELRTTHRLKVSGVALGRIFGQLPSDTMGRLMSEEPEDNKHIASALSWHITSLCAGKAMQTLSKKAADGSMTQDDREQFTKLHAVRKMAIQRTRTIDT